MKQYCSVIAKAISLFIPILLSTEGLAKDVVYFGDSQAVLWMGNVVEGVFSNLPQKCRDVGLPIASRRTKWGFQGYATGSSSFHHWASRGSAKNHICSNERNSVVIESGRKIKGSFRQIEPGICRGKRSPLENAFAMNGGAKLAVFQFMGNSAYRSVRVNGNRVVPSSKWSYNLPSENRRTEFDLTQDIDRFLRQVPRGMPCLVMTTTPNRLKPSARRQRRHAQAVIERDVRNSGRCGFVAGVTPETVSAFDNKASFHGDSFHVSEEGSDWFFDHHLPSICSELRGRL